MTAKNGFSDSDPASIPDQPGILIVCNNGGHLLQAVQLKKIFPRDRVLWVTKKDSDSQSLLPEGFISGFFPTQRHLLNYCRNFWLAVKIFRRHPSLKVVISTGAGISPPFFLAARLFRRKTIFIESFSRVFLPSLSGRLCRPLASRFYVQWEEIRHHYPQAVYRGRIF